MRRPWLALAALLSFLLLLSHFAAAVPSRQRPKYFRATAFSSFGLTRDGSLTRPGIVAADSRVLPLGTRIKVRMAGRYSGVYVVRDTGAKVLGRHIDIYIPSRAAAKQFGVKAVQVTVLRWGDGKPSVGPAATLLLPIDR